jgi:hypothetical protein
MLNHPWNEAYLVMMNDLSDMLLDLICHYFIEDFLHQCSLRRLACSSPFGCVLVWFGDECNIGFIE